MEKEILERVKKLIKSKKGIKEISEELKLKEYEVIGLVEILKESGMNVEYKEGEIIILREPRRKEEIYEIPIIKDTIKMCMISDTHLASKYDRVDIIKYIYEKAERLGVDCILHSGDFTDGRSNRPEHIYELREMSYEGQVDYYVEKYPKSNIIKTYVIAGNHDDWWYKINGSEIVKSIARRREDIVYLGSGCADLKIGKLRVRLFHGKGGISYAKSYKVQKYVDSIPQKELPVILQTGHIHQSFYMKSDRTHCFQTSCLEDQTPFCKNMGFSNDKSCWWVEVDLDQHGNIVNIRQQLECFEKDKVKRM